MTINLCPYCGEELTVLVGKVICVGHDPSKTQCPYRGQAGNDQDEAIELHNKFSNIYNIIKEGGEYIDVVEKLALARAEIARLSTIVNSRNIKANSFDQIKKIIETKQMLNNSGPQV